MRVLPFVATEAGRHKHVQSQTRACRHLPAQAAGSPQSRMRPSRPVRVLSLLLPMNSVGLPVCLSAFGLMCPRIWSPCDRLQGVVLPRRALAEARPEHPRRGWFRTHMPPSSLHPPQPFWLSEKILRSTLPLNGRSNGYVANVHG
ncbi:hypothetical protein WOLCODRAFT_154529 [Wolfiporia cocos MD-104 SS10]|uniref:Uncharacterized protein n=1 Tax=Wolfiporia cocos (strain MD-104) TaxID=742152 RepID=A0A2H3JSN1_WOLCO|nr:hypothetical protein WOLCODRAFT_154529 [Wolfiporia cocos MD-104 SS10]